MLEMGREVGIETDSEAGALPYKQLADCPIFKLKVTRKDFQHSHVGSAEW